MIPAGRGTEYYLRERARAGLAECASPECVGRLVELGRSLRLDAEVITAVLIEEAP